MTKAVGDAAFRIKQNKEILREMTYGGALSFARRRYSRDFDGVDVVVSGIPYDSAVTYRSGCRLGPRAIRAGSVQLAELAHFPFGLNPFDHLPVIDFGDCFLDPHHPDTVFDSITDHADAIIAAGAKMLSLGGDHAIAYPLLKAHAKAYGPIALVQFDAHCDTWPDDGVGFDHGTMFARAVAEGIIDVSKSTQVGLRTYNDSDHGFEILTSPWVHRNGIEAAIDENEDPDDIRGRNSGASKSPSKSMWTASSPASTRGGVVFSPSRGRGDDWNQPSPGVPRDDMSPEMSASATTLEREITRRIEAHGEDHPDVAAAMNDLATLYSENENFERAQALFERALSIQETTRGAELPESGPPLPALSICHLDRGDNKFGRPRLQRALELQTNILGPDHPDVAAIRDVLASLDAEL